MLRETTDYSLNILATSDVLEGKVSEERVSRIIPCLTSVTRVFPDLTKVCLKRATDSASVTWDQFLARKVNYSKRVLSLKGFDLNNLAKCYSYQAEKTKFV